MSLRASLKKFLIERLIPSLTGGYTYYSDQPLFVFWIHSLIFAWAFFVPLVLVNLKGIKTLSLLHPMLTLVFWFFIKLINFQIHSDFDKQDQNQNELNAIPVPMHNGDDEDEQPPVGISKDVWRIRDILTDFSEFSIDFIVEEHIRQGYNPNELFRFYEMYQMGELSDYSMTPRRSTESVVSVPTAIHIFCFEHIVTWTRKDLESWFDRPYKLIEVVVAPLLAAICGVLLCLNSNFVSSMNKSIFVFSTASAQYSLLLAPNPDTSSTTMQDPLTQYSRAFHLIIFQVVFAFLTYLSSVEWFADASLVVFNVQVAMSEVIAFFSEVFNIIIICFPLLNMAGAIGCLKYSWIESLEILQQLFLGKSGQVTFYSSNLSFIIDILIIALLAVFHFNSLENDLMYKLVCSLCVFVGCFFATTNQVPFISNFIGLESNDYYVNHSSNVKSLFVSLGRALWGAVAVFVALLIKISNVDYAFYVISCILVCISILTHYILPELTCFYPFGKFSAPFFSRSRVYEIFIRVATEIGRCILLPLALSFLVRLSRDKGINMHQWIESIVFVTGLTCCTAVSYRLPIRFAVSLFLMIFSNLSHDYALFQMLFDFLLIMKINEAYDKVKLVTTYSSFHSMSSKYQIIVLIVMLANCQFTFFSIVVALILNAPIMNIAGLPIFVPSYPRPTAFWLGPLSYEPKKGDALFYKVISDSLAEKIAKDVERGVFPALSENNFFLICDEYFNAIVHIIGSGVGYVIFQLRGLEVREQTLCHRNELQVIRSDTERIAEMKTFMLSSLVTKFTSLLWRPITKLFRYLKLPEPLPDKHRSFISSSTWDIINDDYKLESYSVSGYRISGLFPDRSHQEMILVNLIKAITLVVSEDDEICVPDDFNGNVQEEIASQVDEWISYHNKNNLKREIFAIAMVMIQEMNKISGDFEWKLFKYFSSSLMNLHDYLWIPALLDEKLIRCFRVSVSLAVYDVCGMLPEENDELSAMMEEKLEKVTVMPESESQWMKLVDDREPVLETVRKIQEDNEVAIKYMIFTKREQSFRLVKLNGEAVRGIWAGQTCETVYMESTDRERPSIQYDSFTLRNIISQSANSPVGYPEVICPISYSFVC